MPSGSRSFIRDHGLHRTNMMLRLRLIHTESGRSSMSQILIKKVRSPTAAFRTKETGPQMAIGESLPLNLVTTSTRCLFLINIAWPRNPRHCVCHRKCWMRFLDHRMQRLSPLRISLVFKMGSLNNCRIARVMHPNNTNQYVHLVELHHQSLLGSLTHTCLRPNHAAPPPRRSLSSS